MSMSTLTALQLYVLMLNEEYNHSTYPVMLNVILFKTDGKWNSNWEVNKDTKHFVSQGSCTTKCQIM